MSFITDLAKRGMETQSQLDESMRARVASTSIWAQKVVDETTAPEISIHRLLGEQFITDRPMYGCAHPDLKGSDQGIRGTFMAAQAYAQQAKDHRDELLAKYGK